MTSKALGAPPGHPEAPHSSPGPPRSSQPASRPPQATRSSPWRALARGLALASPAPPAHARRLAGGGRSGEEGGTDDGRGGERGRPSGPSRRSARPERLSLSVGGNADPKPCTRRARSALGRRRAQRGAALTDDERGGERGRPSGPFRRSARPERLPRRRQAVDLLASSIDRGARRRGGARATAPLPTTCARGAGSDDPSILGHLFLGHAGASRTRLDPLPERAGPRSLPPCPTLEARACRLCRPLARRPPLPGRACGRRASGLPLRLGHVPPPPPPPPPTWASFPRCSPNESRPTPVFNPRVT